MAAIPTTLQARLTAVRERINAACAKAGRDPHDVTLVAVSKTFAHTDVRQAAQYGQRHFGENYLQEALTKLDHSADLDLTWHFIGPIQSNKTRPIAERFDWVHTVDREKIARRLSEQRAAATRPPLNPLNVCIEVNISGEASKSGVRPADVSALAQCIAGLPALRLRGLMAIPEPNADVSQQQRQFALLRTLQEALRREGFALDTLSMGMSADLEAAIAEGATLVRVGTAIFGERARR